MIEKNVWTKKSLQNSLKLPKTTKKPQKVTKKSFRKKEIKKCSCIMEKLKTKQSIP